MIIIIIALAVGCYFLGDISPARLVGRLYGVDITKEGSGNPGTTNVLRVLGKKAALFTLAIDVLKGVVPVLLARGVASAAGLDFRTGALLSLIFAMAAFLGHIWPVLYGFKGGKGIATAFGISLAIRPFMGLILLLCALAGMVLTKKVSFGSIVGAICFPILCWFLVPSYSEALGGIYLAWAIVLAAIAIFRHRSNIVRLARGEESNISFKK